MPFEQEYSTGHRELAWTCQVVERRPLLPCADDCARVTSLSVRPNLEPFAYGVDFRINKIRRGFVTLFRSEEQVPEFEQVRRFPRD